MANCDFPVNTRQSHNCIINPFRIFLVILTLKICFGPLTNNTTVCSFGKYELALIYDFADRALHKSIDESCKMQKF